MDRTFTDPRPVGRILADQAERYGDKPYLLYQDRVISYAQMYEKARRVGRGFWDWSIRKEDKVALFLGNRPEFQELFYGLLSIGAVEVPINVNLKGDLLSYIVNHSDARAIVVEAEYLPRLIEIKDHLLTLERVVVVDAVPELPRLPWTVSAYSDLDDSPDQLPEVAVGPTDLAGIVYTSGTTGPSKGVMASHHYFYNYAAGWSWALGVTEDDIYYSCLPHFHMAGQLSAAYVAMISGATMALDRRFSASGFWASVRRYGATTFNLLGSMSHMLMKQPPGPSDRDHQVKFGLSAPVPAAIFEEFQQRFGVRLLELYGMTETNLPLYTPRDAVRPGACGKTWGTFDVEIVDENDWPMPPGQTGEIVTRPKFPHIMMSGYYKMPDKTVEAFRNLWFHTGDWGYKDLDGYVYFVDRKKDSIRRRGENISSYEVEKVVDSHDSVLESAAVAVPSAEMEDEVKVVVVLQPGAQLDQADLVRFCAQRMAYFMVPRYVEFAAELPKTSNGKVQKHVLRSQGIHAGTWDREKAGIKVER